MLGESREKSRELQWACSCVAQALRPFWDFVWPCMDTWDSVRLRTASTHWNVPGYGPHGELFFFLIKKELVVASNEVLPNPCLWIKWQSVS